MEVYNTMIKIKAAISSVVIVVGIMVTSLLPVMAQTDVNQSINGSTIITDQQGYTLSWEKVKGGKILSKVETDSGEFSYEYNENKNRISKTSGDETFKYTYDNDLKLVSEVRGNNTFTYLYDLNSKIGFKLNDELYYFIKDSDLNVIAITDSNNNEIVKYEYNQNGIATAILGKDSIGNWVDKSSDNSFVGTLNLIRLHSYYYDSETGWYYNGNQYYDSANNKYVGGIDNLDSVSTFKGFVKNSSIITPQVTPELITSIGYWQGTLMNTSGFGRSISYSSGWYSGLSDVELLSRLLYGENTYNTADQHAVAWVIINRKNKNSTTFGGNTYRGVATKSGAFEPITGGSDGTSNARVPDTSSLRWSSAVWAACTLLSTPSMDDYRALIPQPTGISSQLYFVGLNYFLSSYSNGNPISKDASPAGSGLLYSFGSSSSYVGIKDVAIVFDTLDTILNPTSKSSITNNTRLDSSGERGQHNIFFNEK